MKLLIMWTEFAASVLELAQGLEQQGYVMTWLVLCKRAVSQDEAAHVRDVSDVSPQSGFALTGNVRCFTG